MSLGMKVAIQGVPECESSTFNMKIKDFHQTVRDAAASCTFSSKPRLTLPVMQSIHHMQQAIHSL